MGLTTRWGSWIIAAAAGLSLAAVAVQAATPKENEKGAELYHQICISCHGKYGRGDGPLAPDLTVHPPDFTRPQVLAGRTDQQVMTAITTGNKHMPMAFARAINPQTLLAAIEYIRTLSVPGKHVSVLAGEDIYNSTCWFCHGMKGDGKGPVAKNVKGTKPRDFTNPNFVINGREGELYKTITIGAAASFHGNPEMLEWGSKLTDQQRRDVIEYLKVLKAEAKRH